MSLPRRLLLLLATLAALGAFAAPAAAPTRELALVIPISVLRDRLRHEAVYEYLFAIPGDATAAAYFRGRREIYRDLLDELERLPPPDDPSAPAPYQP